LHLAATQGHVDVVRVLLAAGADPSIRDSKHDGDAKGWAEYGRVPRSPNAEEMVRILEGAAG
jgi:ankyrin repeat protein